jgi:hypothetical protein
MGIGASLLVVLLVTILYLVAIVAIAWALIGGTIHLIRRHK